MKTETIVMCVVALLLGMLLFHMLTNVCGCKTVEGQHSREVKFDAEGSAGDAFEGTWAMEAPPNAGDGVTAVVGSPEIVKIAL